MHYKCGTEAKLGDIVRCATATPYPVQGPLTFASSGSSTCNGVIMHTMMSHAVSMGPNAVALEPHPVQSTAYITIGDCELVYRKP
jgi:hypothetical protein